MKYSSTDAALRAFETRPMRGEALADLARHFREAGMNETAAMFARRGLAVPPSGDLLFVEGVRDNLREDLSISGYYSADSETRRLAGEECDALALDRDAPRWLVEHARNVLFWHAPKLVELAPSWQAQQIRFKPPSGWVAMNPSVTRYLGRTVAIMRVVNYWIKPDGGYTFPQGEPAISTRNFLVELSPLGVAINPIEVVPDLGPMLYDGVRGLEDLRIFPWNGELRFIAAARQMNPDGWVEQVVGRLGLDGTIDGLEVVRRSWRQSCEKNWMPIIGAESNFGEPYYVYRCDPTMVVSAGMTNEPERRDAPIAADNFSGSSQLIPFDDGWLCMTHEPLASPINGRRLNQQRFVQFDNDLRVIGYSRRFHFQLNEEIEYVMGLCRENDGDERLIISYGSHDRQAWVGTVDVVDVRRMLRLCQKQRNATVVVAEKPAPQVSLNDLLPSWQARRLAFDPPEGFAAKSPSVINYKGRLLASVRCINYAANDEEGYHRIADVALNYKPVSRTFLLEFDSETLIDSVLGELNLPLNPTGPSLNAPAYGFEDIRLFEWGGDLWGIAAFSEQSVDGLSEQWIVRISGSTILSDARHVVPRGMVRRSEKNWMPFIGMQEPRFVYSSDPTVIVDAWGHVVVERTSEIVADHLHGGSQVIPFDGGWLAIVRWRQILDDTNKWVDFEYRNLFVWFDTDFNLKRISPVLKFPIDPAVSSFPRRFQLAHGLAWHPDGKRLVVGYDLYERESWLATVNAEDVRAMMSERKSRFPNEQWMRDQTNRTLQDMTAVDYATQSLAAAGLPLHRGNHQKNWDTYLAVWHCLNNCAPDDVVLDIGGDGNSSFLGCMRALGYNSLFNVNINEPNPRYENGIKYAFGDATALMFESRSVRFALCQSVIEHGVDWRVFYKEMARILVPRGHLFVSTDFWDSQVWDEVFTSTDIHEMVTYASELGLILTGALDLDCRDACIDLGGKRYTFVNLLFRLGESSNEQPGQFPYVARARRLGKTTFDLWITDAVDEAWYGREDTIEADKLWCLENIRPGMTVIDCGAHHGQTTVVFAKTVTETGRVIAFEALAENADCIKNNLSLNNCQNVEVHAHALGLNEGVANFAHNGGNSQRGETGDQIRVRSLDDVVGHLDRIDFMKIDVEGCELDVLHGALGVIKRHRPLLDIEVHNMLVSDPGRNIDGILALLSPYRYRYLSPGFVEGNSLKEHLIATGAHLFCEPA